MGKARTGAGRGVGQAHVEAVEHLPHVVGGLGHALVRREPVVDRHHAPVGDHVAGDAAGDADRVQAFPVDQPVDLDLGRTVRAEPVQHLARRMDRVGPHPPPRAVRRRPGDRYRGAQRPVAAALDDGAGRLQQHREVPGQPFGMVPRHPPETVLRRLDLLVVVEDVGEIPVRSRNVGRQP